MLDHKLVQAHRWPTTHVLLPRCSMHRLSRPCWSHDISYLLALPQRRTCHVPLAPIQAARVIATRPAKMDHSLQPQQASQGAAASISPHLGPLALGPAGKRWQGVSKWIVFTDLHVSPRTLDVCLNVLRRVKQEAKAQDAGIVFLGEAVCLLGRALAVSIAGQPGGGGGCVLSWPLRICRLLSQHALVLGGGTAEHRGDLKVRDCPRLSFEFCPSSSLLVQQMITPEELQAELGLACLAVAYVQESQPQVVRSVGVLRGSTAAQLERLPAGAKTV